MVIQTHNLCLDDRIVDAVVLLDDRIIEDSLCIGDLDLSGNIFLDDRIIEDRLCMDNNIYVGVIKIPIGGSVIYRADTTLLRADTTLYRADYA